MAKLYTIFVGLNDKETKKQEITTAEAEERVKAVTCETFEGATVSLAYGIYKHQNGVQVTENTIRIELVFVDDDLVKEYVEKLKNLLNQESIMVTVVETMTEFW